MYKVPDISFIGQIRIGTTVFLQDVLSVDNTDFSVTLYIFLAISWQESRIVYEGIEDVTNKRGITIYPTFVKQGNFVA